MNAYIHGLPRHAVLPWLVATALAAHPSLGTAAEAGTQTDLYTGKTLTGDWGGTRSELHDKGIEFRGGVIYEGFNVNSGGIEHGYRGATQAQVGVDFDLGKLTSFWGDARVHVTIDDRHGGDPSTELVGNSYMPVSWSYGTSRTHWAEVSYDQNFLDGKVNWRIGFYSIGNFFASPGIATNFVNGGLTGHPMTLSTNSGWGNFPNSRWNTHVTVQATPELALRAGLVIDNSKYSLKENSWRLHVGGSPGHTYPVELQWTPGSASHSHYPGDYKVGYYYGSAPAAMVGDRSGRTASHRDGAYVMGSQKLTNNAVDGGLSIFAHYTRQSQTTSAIHTWSSAGLVYRGLFQARPNDGVALAYVRASLNRHIVNQQLERQALGLIVDPDWQVLQAQELWEASYTFEVNPWLTLRPDVQYLVNPGTFSNKAIDNALAIGFQVRVKF